jgi:hypothetical protein
MTGHEGDDTLKDGPGSDFMQGDVWAPGGNDNLEGGPGHDTFWSPGGLGQDQTGGYGTDHIDAVDGGKDYNVCSDLAVETVEADTSDVFYRRDSTDPAADDTRDKCDTVNVHGPTTIP